MTIVQPGFEGSNTPIVGLEAQVDGEVQSIKATEVEGREPTYLKLFVQPKSVYLRDLSVGFHSYVLRVIDILRNKSERSP